MRRTGVDEISERFEERRIRRPCTSHPYIVCPGCGFLKDPVRRSEDVAHIEECSALFQRERERLLDLELQGLGE